MNNYDVIDLDDDEHCQPIQMSSVKRLHFTGIIILNLPICSQVTVNFRNINKIFFISTEQRDFVYFL